MRFSLILFIGSVFAGLEQIEHVVFFMQENRAFDHYYSTLAGVRGLQDPNTINAIGNSTFLQNTPLAPFLSPYPINYKGDVNSDAIQCMMGVDNGLNKNQASLDRDLNDNWVLDNTPASVAYFTRQNLPTHYKIQDEYLISDMYQESVIASTNPNRISWMTGTVGFVGGPTSPSQGGPFIDNSETPGCEKVGESNEEWSCYPGSWKTVPEYLEETNSSWNVYQSNDNFGDNPLAFFAQYQVGAQYDPTGPLATKGMTMTPTSGLEQLQKDAAAGTLPFVSYYIGPAEQSEHPPFSPRLGGFLQQQVIEAIVNSPKWNNTALIISYDESGGWADHVIPYHSPMPTGEDSTGGGEWYINPFTLKPAYSGPGFRVPMTIVSPWTRKSADGESKVFTERSDHSSQIMFLEKLAAAHGRPFISQEVNHWRRNHMSDLTNAFDWANPRYDVPVPLNNDESLYNTTTEDDLPRYAQCLALYPTAQPDAPYSQQNDANYLSQNVEKGYRATRGFLSEGRHLVFESQNGLSLTASAAGITSAAGKKQSNPLKRLVIRYTAESQQEQRLSTFTLQFAFLTGPNNYVGAGLTLVGADKATVYSLQPVGGSYTIVEVSSGQYLSLDGAPTLSATLKLLNIYSVTF